MTKVIKKTIVTILLLCTVCMLACFAACGKEKNPSSSMQGGDTNCEHVWSEWTTEEEATCQTTGLKSRTCTLCGGKEEKVIEKTYHKYNVESKCEYCGVELVYTSGLTYEQPKYSSNYVVTGIGSATESDIVIPAYHAGEKVIGIAEKAFYGNDKITSVVAPAIEEIGSNAFYYCEKLETIQFNSVTEIGINAFSNCKKLNTIVLREEKIEISKDVFADTGYFNNDKNWENNTLYIGKHLISVKEDFDGTEFNIKVGTVSVASYALNNVLSIETINFPDNEIFISPYAFYGCSNWKEFEVTDEIELTNYSISGTSLTKLVVPSKYILGSILDKRYDYKKIGIPSTIKTLIVTDSLTLYGVRCDFSDFEQLEYLEHKYIYTGNVDLREIYKGLKNLKTLIMPGYGYNSKDRYTHIGEYFSSTYFDGSVPVTAYIDGENKTYYFPASLKEITIDGGYVTNKMFYGCDNFQSITIKNLRKNEDGYNIGNGWSGSSSPFYNVKCEKLSIDKSASIIPDIYAQENLQAPFNGVKNFYYSGTMQEWCSIKHMDLYADNIYIDGQKMEGIVTIPDGITEISEDCFNGFENVSKFIIPDSVTSIGGYAFYGTAFYDNEENWENGVLYCGKHLIKSKTENCRNVGIKEGTLVIADRAFNSSANLPTELSIPDSVTSIGKEAFKYCKSLTSITIPSSVTSIGSHAFDYCSSLTEIKYDAVDARTTGVYRGQNGSIANAPFDGSAENKVKLTIGNKVKSLPDGIFANLNVKEVVFVDGSECKSIGNYAFYDCDYLMSIEIPNGVTSIGFEAFRGCSSLTSVTIGDSVMSIGDYAFYACNSLESINVDKDNENYSSVDGILYNKSQTEFIHIPKCIKGSFTIPDTITSIGSSAFSGCSSLVSVTIPNSVTSIGSSAFSGCSSLVSVTIPNSVTSIGSSAFSGCSALTSVTIGNVVTSIGDSAFRGCSSLTSIEIPNSVTSIGSSVFSGCSALTSVMIGESVTSIGSSAFEDCSSLTSITIPDSVKSIANSAFYNCSSMASVTIGNGVKSIGSWAFSDCSSIENIYYNGDINDWVQIEGLYNLIYYGKSSKNLYINRELLTEANITTATKINDHAFHNYDSLTSVTIGNSVTSIGVSAFYGCSSLVSITIPNSVTSIGSCALKDCKLLTSVTIPNSVTSIESSTFSGCSSLTSVTIPNSVTSIESSAFSGCSSLVSVTIPNSVTSIGHSTFSGCSSLTSITFSDTSTWYRTNYFSSLNNKSGGTQTSVTNSSINATYFKSTYKDYYWYKI